MNLQDLAGTLSGLGIGGGVGAVITGLFARRRNRVDALVTLEGIATRLAENATAAADRRVSEVERQLAEHKAATYAGELRRRESAERHMQWDNEVRQALLSLDVDMPAPPPLEMA